MTDTGVKKAKVYIKRAKPTILSIINIKEKGLVLLCLVSLFTVDKNSFLCVLPLVIMQMCSDKASMYMCGGLSAMFYISTVISTSFYVPCMAFLLVYLLGDYMLQHGAVKPVWFAAAVFALCKSYVLTFGYDSAYWLVLAVETMGLVLLPQIVCDGFKLIRENRQISAPIHFFDVSAAMLAGAAALSGVNVYSFNFSAFMLLTAAFYFVSKENIPLSVTAFLSMTLLVSQDKNFSFLFAGFAVIYIGSTFLLPNGNKGYISTALLSMTVTLLFITRFNSFVFAVITSSALAAAFLLNKFCYTRSIEKTDEMTGESDYIQLVQKLAKLDQCFNFLGHTVIDISNLLVKEDIPHDVSDAVAERVCKKCKNCTVCWQQNYSHTQSQFSNYAHCLEKGKRPSFDSLFLSRCEKLPHVEQAFEQSYRLENAKQLIYQSGRHNQKILQNQFLTMSQVLKDISHQSRRWGIVNTAYTHTISSLLLSMGKRVDYCVCYQNNSRCIINTGDSFDSEELYRIKLKLENIYEEKFAEAVKAFEEENIVYTFCAIPMFTAEFGTDSKSRYSVCGDICEILHTEDHTFVILADGMGTGSFAAAESRTAVTMLKNLLLSGVRVETALEITNTALNLKGTGQSCVALDILMADCYSGKSTLYKAGGAASIIMDKTKIRRLYKDSLPIGILKDIKTAQFDFTLNNGDVLILLSDGVDLKEELLCKAKLMVDKLAPQELSQLIITGGATTDDATAAVFRFVRK